MSARRLFRLAGLDRGAGQSIMIRTVGDLGAPGTPHAVIFRSDRVEKGDRGLDGFPIRHGLEAPQRAEPGRDPARRL
jgi:hypothetical protein